jgi:triosephosphate isomerase (TIM)
MSDPTARPRVIAGNWKMHHLRQDAERFCARLKAGLGEKTAGEGRVEVLLFPSFTLLPTVARQLAGSAVGWGGQDLHPAEQGAHTGDVSGAQLADVGCSWVLCGHSERRQDHREGDDLVGHKALAARRSGLKPMICLGETAAEREAGQTFAVLERQLRAALRPGGESAEGGDGGDGAESLDAFALAYEPVWAIGTGATATPELAQEAHAFLRRLLGDLLGEARAGGTAILYGGSVKPGNAAELIAPADIDGFLIGGASLDPDSFLDIIGVCGTAA